MKIPQHILALIEQWADIPGYESKYQVSRLGGVKSLANDYTRKEKILKPNIYNTGYLKVTLYKEGKSKQYLVHRLVALAFIPNPSNYPIINHKDEIKTNNTVWNLEFCTYKYNNNYGSKNERISTANKGKKPTEEHKANISKSKKGKQLSEEHKANISEAKKKPILMLDMNNNILAVFDSVGEAKEYLGKPRTDGGISNCAKGRYKTAYKHQWKYIEIQTL